MPKIIATSSQPATVKVINSGIRLTSIPLIGWLLRKSFLMASSRIVSLFMLITVIFTGLWFEDAKVGLATLLAWGIFWPLFTCLVTPTLGNLFCSICPHGFIGRWLNQHGLRKPFPKRWRGVWGGLVMIMLGYWLAAYVVPGALSGSTRVTAWYFLIFTIMASTVFFIYKDMAWCKHLCPLGRLLSLHSKVAVLSITTDKKNCQSCRTFDCATSCQYHLSPFLFEKRNNMDACTLCMDCISSCDSVHLTANLPGNALKKPILGQDRNDMWVYLVIFAVAGIGIQFLHGLHHSPLKPHLPWIIIGDWLQSLTTIERSFINFGGMIALIMALVVTLSVAAYGYYRAALLAKVKWRVAANTLSVALAPVAIIGLIPHALSVFATRTAHDFANEIGQLMGYSWQIKPLAARGDAWMSWLSLLPYMAMVWALWLVWQRAALLVDFKTERIKVWVYGALPVFVYAGIFLIKLLSIWLMTDSTQHH